jgi:hypothetical protein
MQAEPHQVLYWPQTRYPCFWVLSAPPDADRFEVFRNETRVYPGGGVDLLVDYWAEVNSNIPHLAEAFNSQLLTVRFEDLCADVNATLNRIAQFCDLPAFEGEQRDDYGRDVDSMRNSKYLNVLSGEQIARFLCRAEPVRRQFGYVQDRAGSTTDG